MENEERLDTLEQKVEDLHEAVDLFAERTDRRFDAIDQRFDAVDLRFDAMEKKFATKTEIREIVDDAFERHLDRLLGTVKKVDKHVDAVVDTAADRKAITADDRRKLHAMEPFPKLVKDA